MAECSNCGHENPDWVPVALFVEEQQHMAKVKNLLVSVVDSCHKALDIFGVDVQPPKPAGEVRKFRRRDDGKHRGPRL